MRGSLEALAMFPLSQIHRETILHALSKQNKPRTACSNGPRLFSLLLEVDTCYLLFQLDETPALRKSKMPEVARFTRAAPGILPTSSGCEAVCLYGGSRRCRNQPIYTVKSERAACIQIASTCLIHCSKVWVSSIRPSLNMRLRMPAMICIFMSGGMPSCSSLRLSQ